MIELDRLQDCFYHFSQVEKWVFKSSEKKAEESKSERWNEIRKLKCEIAVNYVDVGTIEIISPLVHAFIDTPVFEKRFFWKKKKIFTAFDTVLFEFTHTTRSRFALWIEF